MSTTADQPQQQQQLAVVAAAPPAACDRLTAFTAAWKSVDQTIQHRLAPPRLTQVPEGVGCTVLALCMAPITQAALAPSLAKPDGEGAGAAGDGKDKDGKNKCVRVPFAVLKVLSPGWSHVDGVEGRNGNSSKASSSNGKEAKEKLARFLPGSSNNEHVMMHSFELNKKSYHRGARSHAYVIVSPGMVFTLKAWGDKIPKIFSAHGAVDVAPFDIALIEISTKSLAADGRDAMLDIRSFRTVSGLSAASRTLVPPHVAFSSMAHAGIMQAHFCCGTHVAAATTAAAVASGAAQHDALVSTAFTTDALPEGLSQEWLKGNLAGTISLIRVTPTAGTFAVGPDEVLRFHSEGPLVDLPCNTLTVRYDKRQYPSTSSSPDGGGSSELPDQWTVKLLNIAVLAGAVELLVAVDTYTGRDESRGPSLEAYARIDVSVLTHMLLRTPRVPVIPAGIVTAFTAQGMEGALRHLAVFPLTPNSTTHHLVLDLRKLVRRAPAAAPAAVVATTDDSASSPASSSTTTAANNAANTNNTKPPPLPLLAAFVPVTGAWERGHNVHIFIEGRLVFHFIAPVHLQGADALNTRVFEAMPIPKLEDADYEADEAEEEAEEAAAITMDAEQPAPAAAAAAAAATAAAAPATAAAGKGGKRKRPAEDEAAAVVVGA